MRSTTLFLPDKLHWPPIEENQCHKSKLLMHGQASLFVLPATTMGCWATPVPTFIGPLQLMTPHSTWEISFVLYGLIAKLFSAQCYKHFTFLTIKEVSKAKKFAMESDHNSSSTWPLTQRKWFLLLKYFQQYGVGFWLVDWAFFSLLIWSFPHCLPFFFLLSFGFHFLTLVGFFFSFGCFGFGFFW